MDVLNLNSVINQIVPVRKTFLSAETVQTQSRRSLVVNKGAGSDYP